jgi:hypothetical protein
VFYYFFTLIVASFLYFNFEHLDSLSVSGCKDITFIVPTSFNYNKANSRALLQPPQLPPTTDISSPLSESAIIREEYDNRSLTSSGSSTYSSTFSINPYDDINPTAHFRPISPPVRTNSFYSDNSSDCSTPPLSPRSSITLDPSHYTLRSATPPPELKICEAPSSPRSLLHSGRRSGSDGSSTPPLTKLKRSSSVADTPGNRRSGSEIIIGSPGSPNFIRGGSWDKNASARSVTGMARSGSIDMGKGDSVNEYHSSAGTNTDSYSTNYTLNGSSHYEEASNNHSPNSLTASGGNANNNNITSTTSPILHRAGKRLNIIGIGRSSGETSPEPGSSSRSKRNSIKLFSLTRSSEGPPDANLLSPPPTSSSSTTSTSPNKGSPIESKKSEQKFSEMQFLNCSNCTSIVDKSLQALALQKLPLQCLYLSNYLNTHIYYIVTHFRSRWVCKNI